MSSSWLQTLAYTPAPRIAKRIWNHLVSHVILMESYYLTYAMKVLREKRWELKNLKSNSQNWFMDEVWKKVGALKTSQFHISFNIPPWGPILSEARPKTWGANYQVTQLSGGMKRKLSVGLAFSGREGWHLRQLTKGFFPMEKGWQKLNSIGIVGPHLSERKIETINGPMLIWICIYIYTYINISII